MAGRFGAAFADAEFRAIWAASGLSMVGDQLARVALVVLVYGDTGSAALTGLTFALTLAPSSWAAFSCPAWPTSCPGAG